MLCIISPTKTLAEETCALAKGTGVPLLLESACKRLITRCKELSQADLKSLMSISDPLAKLNYDRYKDFDNQKSYPAAELFDGPSFRALNVEDFSETERMNLDNSLCILSGLYGLLRPSDAMQPYRLEMGTRLKVDEHPNLYKYWEANGLTDALAALAKEKNAHTILNCASQEYSKVVDAKILREKHGLNFVDCNFKARGGRMAAVYAKQARGMMVRYVAKLQPKSIEELYAFSGADGLFKCSPKETDGSKLTFERYDKVQTAGGDERLFSGTVKPSSKTHEKKQKGDTEVKDDQDDKQKKTKTDEAEEEDMETKKEDSKATKKRGRQTKSSSEVPEDTPKKTAKATSKRAKAASEPKKLKEDPPEGLRRSARNKRTD